MEEIKNVLALFDNAEKWNSFIELSNMRDDLVNELKNRLNIELEKIANNNLVDSRWSLCCDHKNIMMKPSGTSLIGITIEWQWWSAIWCRRGVCIWIDAKNIDSMKVFSKIKDSKSLLPLHGYEENIRNHSWFPFVKQIPAKVFNVDDNITSADECLFMAIKNAELLAQKLWDEVFKPFLNNETADAFENLVTE